MSEMGFRSTEAGIDLTFDADPLESAVLIALFTDARVAADDLPEGEQDARGFWGDAMTGDVTGSRLWLISREKVTNEVVRLVEDYVRDGLSRFVSHGVLGSAIVEARYDDQQKLQL